MIKTRRSISEYCLFFKKKIYEIIHFNRNLRKDGWDYSAIRFKSFAQKVLFNPVYDLDTSFIREYDLDSSPESEIYGPNTSEFNSLSQIYDRHPVDIKSYLGTIKSTTIRNLRDCTKKGLIFPYLSINNLTFQEKISIVLPHVRKELNDKLIKVFSFFNRCHIYEIEGNVCIYGFEDIQSFENGLLIEIWFPKCELDEFMEVFDFIFEYCKIKHYLILTDLVDGKHLITSTFGDLAFLDLYNPLKNLIWNEKDKIWMNHKLYTSKFEPIYPDLLYGNKKDV